MYEWFSNIDQEIRSIRGELHERLDTVEAEFDIGFAATT
jgi:hypothetical protein